MALTAAPSPTCTWLLLAASYTTWILTLLWVFFALGGVGTTGSQLFNWHPVLASGALLAVMTPGVLLAPARSANGGARDWRVKALHALCLVTAFVVLSVAITVAYASRARQNKPHLYSLHSWLGVGTLLAMKGNVAAGLASALCVRLRAVALLSASHRVIGVVACLMAFLGAAAGLAEMQIKLADRADSVWRPAVVLGGLLGAATMGVGLALAAVLLSRELHRRGEQRDGGGVVAKKLSAETSNGAS